ncbi:MAG TPA: alpha/beta hydrolase [Rhodanobacteraceae bacterium]
MLASLTSIVLAVAMAMSGSPATTASRSAKATAARTTVIDLWPGSPPAGSGKGPSVPEHVIDKTPTSAGLLKDIATPRIKVWHPAHPDGTAVLVIGGGGYTVIAMAQESLPLAHWLLRRGVTPVVLYYRLPSDGWAPVAPFQDAQRAMRLLRQHAKAWHIDPRHIGVVGFSAGGNLAGITATRCRHDFYAPVDKADRFSACPDFVGLIYPVTSLADDHSGTRAQLATQKNAVAAYSVQKHVDARTPPMFIVQAENDPVVNVDDSLALFRVLHQYGVPAELHLFARGKHGFGLGRPGTRSVQWPRLFAGWMTQHGWLPPTRPAPARSTP